jgi:glutaredoxin
VYQRQIVLYTRSRSLRCWRAKRLLGRAGYRYKVVDATDDPGMLTEISEVVHHEVALPYVFVDHRPLGDLGTVRALVVSGQFEHVLRDDL